MATKTDLEIYSTHNEGKSVISERFITTLNNFFKIKKKIFLKPVL